MTIYEYIEKRCKYQVVRERPRDSYVCPYNWVELSRVNIEKTRKIPTTGGVIKEIPLSEVTYQVWKMISYKDLINKLIRMRYDQNEEFSLLRQRDSKVDEFTEYSNYVEECKSLAKKFIAEREEALL